MKKQLPSVTLLGLDCLDIDRLIQAAEICKKDFEFADVKLLTSLPSTHESIVPIETIDRISKYSNFMIHKVNSYVETSHVLIIQYDGFILNPAAWTDEFLEYDYIGAPWWRRGEMVVGNGGFSLRSKKLLDILQNDPEIIPIPEKEPEDIYICYDLREVLEKKGIKFAPVELAKKFAIEANEIVGHIWTDQLGFHGLRWTDISNWTTHHPQYKIDNTLVEIVKDGKIVQL
ncbi:MAG: DUF5672 family protein [Candidatus Gracilibacteria bacterium]